MTAYPPEYVGTLVFGLSNDSRYKRAAAGIKGTTIEILISVMVDRLNDLVWLKTKNGQKGRNRPASITESVAYGKTESKKSVRAVTPEEFKKEWNKITQKGGN